MVGHEISADKQVGQKNTWAAPGLEMHLLK